MRVLLVWPYNPHALELPELFPLGLGYLLANMDPVRHQTRILDCTLNNLAPESAGFEQHLNDFQPDVVGISFWSSNAIAVYATVNTVRRLLPSALVVFGGPHATSYGVYEIEQGHADFVVAGEGEYAFSQLMDLLADCTPLHLRQIPGLIYRQNGTVCINPVQFENELDRLGKVDYSALNLVRYHQAGYRYSGQAVLHDTLPSALIVSTRGCPYRCRFCSAPNISGRRIRMHSPAYVAETIRELYEEFGVRIISLGDDNFTIDQRYATALCSAISALNLHDLIMTSPNGFRLTSLTPDLAGLLKNAGWEEVTIAPESGSPHTLELMHKDMDLELVAPFVDMCADAGLKVKANFMIGFPGETLDDVLATETFIRKNRFDQIGLSFFQPLPGTPVYEDLIEGGEIDSEFIPGRFNQLTYCPRGIDKHELCALFNRIKNEFRDRQGWTYKNPQVGTIRC